MNGLTTSSSSSCYLHLKHTFKGIRNLSKAIESNRVVHTDFSLYLQLIPKDNGTKIGVYLYHKGKRVVLEYILRISVPNTSDFFWTDHFTEPQREELSNNGVGDVIDRQNFADDELTIECAARVVAGGLKNIGYVYSSALSDASIIVDNELIPIHKYILGHYSPVFKAVFISQMKESRTNEINISDFSVDTVKAFISFLYLNAITGDHSIDFIFTILKLADKYLVAMVMDLCFKYIENHMDVSNCVIIFLNAYSNSWLDLLKLSSICFFDNREIIVEQHEDQVLLMENEHWRALIRAAKREV